jgi:DNA-directed RNA polymerase specialized sigma24 family protein
MAATGLLAGTREDILRTYALVYGGVGNRPDAEKLTTEVFARLRGSDGWTLGAVADDNRRSETIRAVLADYWRRHFGAEWPAGGGHPHSAGVSGLGEHRQRAESVLAELPANCRTLLELRFWRGCSIKELAGRMGLSVRDATRLQFAALRSAAALGMGARAAAVPTGGSDASGS